VQPLLRPAPPLGLALVATVLSSCAEEGSLFYPIETPTTGTIVAAVTADGSAQQGVTLRLYPPGSNTATSTQTTDDEGLATFEQVDPGVWQVDVEPPPGFDLAPGEEASRIVTVTAELGVTTNVSFALVDTFSGVEVTASDDLTFSQANVNISAGTSVRWVNAGEMLHTVTPDGHSEWTSTELPSKGSMFLHTFETPGTYEYFCEPHRPGMSGTVTVS